MWIRGTRKLKLKYKHLHVPCYFFSNGISFPDFKEKSNLINKYQVSSINFISIKHYIKIHQDKKDIYTTKSYGGVGWKANEA